MNTERDLALLVEMSMRKRTEFNRRGRINFWDKHPEVRDLVAGALAAGWDLKAIRPGVKEYFDLDIDRTKLHRLRQGLASGRWHHPEIEVDLTPMQEQADAAAQESVPGDFASQPVPEPKPQPEPDPLPPAARTLPIEGNGNGNAEHAAIILLPGPPQPKIKLSKKDLLKLPYSARGLLNLRRVPCQCGGVIHQSGYGCLMRQVGRAKRYVNVERYGTGKRKRMNAVYGACAGCPAWLSDADHEVTTTLMKQARKQRPQAPRATG